MNVAQPVQLGDADIEEFGREVDAIRAEQFASRGARDRAYILRVIRTQRGLEIGGRLAMFASLLLLPAWGHALAGWGACLATLAFGAATLGLAKILENMEIAHNVMHAQWDWMNDPDIQSSTWEWDIMGPSDRWIQSHNVIHHKWVNVVGKDNDLGYYYFRVTPLQPWRLRDLWQPLWLVLATVFEVGIALHEPEIWEFRSGRKRWRDISPLVRHIGRKVWRQVRKDYIMWPCAAALIAFALSLSPLLAFGMVAGANAAANVLRNLWTFMIIFCGHFGHGVHNFTEEQVANETRGQWYVRQMLGSCNIAGGRLFHILTGNLSHQIEHHLFPDLCSNRLPEIAPRVRALAARYGLPYNTGSLTRQFGTAVLKILRLSLPGPRIPQPALVPDRSAP